MPIPRLECFRYSSFGDITLEHTEPEQGHRVAGGKLDCGCQCEFGYHYYCCNVDTECGRLWTTIQTNIDAEGLGYIPVLGEAARSGVSQAGSLC